MPGDEHQYNPQVLKRMRMSSLKPVESRQVSIRLKWPIIHCSDSTGKTLCLKSV